MRSIKKGTRKFLALALAGILMTTGLGGCAKKNVSAETPAEKKLTTIRYANLKPGLNSAYFELGVEQGIFEKYGADISGDVLADSVTEGGLAGYEKEWKKSCCLVHHCFTPFFRCSEGTHLLPTHI